MKFGVQYSYWEYNWSSDLKKYCKKIAELGFDILEVSGIVLLDMSVNELIELEKEAEDARITITTCHGMSKDCDTSSLDGSTRRRGIEVAKKIFDRMDKINCKQLGGILYSYWPTYDFSSIKTNINDAREVSLRSMTEIADEAKQHDITLMLEIVNRFENFIFNDVKSAVEYIKRLNRDNVKLLLDSFHMNIEEDNLGDAIRYAGCYMGHFHIGECNRKVTGEGHMQWDDIAQGLKDINYQGAVVIETFVRMGGEIGDSIRVWRSLVEADEVRLDRDITRALTFVKNKFN